MLLLVLLPLLMKQSSSQVGLWGSLPRIFTASSSPTSPQLTSQLSAKIALMGSGSVAAT